MERSAVMRRNRGTGRLTRDGVGAHVWHFRYYKRNKKALRNAMQDAAVQCSHFIFLCRYHKKWEPQALRDTWVPPQKGNSKKASAETCGKSNENESSECVRSSQASSDKDNSSPLLIKTVFAVISEDMIR